MRKRLTLFLLSVSLLQLQHSLFAQYYFYDNQFYEKNVVFETGAGLGMMNALTDLGGKKGPGKGFLKDLNARNARPCASIYFLGIYKDAIGCRLECNFGQVTAADSVLKNVDASTYGRYERNLSFKSPITEFELVIEIHPLFFQNKQENHIPLFSPYLIAGIGIFSFNPQAKLNGQWYALAPLRTEGQGFSEYPGHHLYKLTQLNYPAGVGIRYEISSLFSLRFEINHRFLKTDYLDDVSTVYIDPDLFYHYLPPGLATVARQLYSRKKELMTGEETIPGYQRGNPANNDSYFSLQFKLGIKLGRERR